MIRYQSYIINLMEHSSQKKMTIKLMCDQNHLRCVLSGEKYDKVGTRKRRMNSAMLLNSL